MAHITYRQLLLKGDAYWRKGTLSNHCGIYVIGSFALCASSASFLFSLTVLKYAQRARTIVNRAVINEDPNAKIIRGLLETLRKRQWSFIHRLALTMRKNGLSTSDWCSLFFFLFRVESRDREAQTFPWRRQPGDKCDSSCRSCSVERETNRNPTSSGWINSVS